AGHLLRLDLVFGALEHDSAAASELEALRAEMRTTVFEVRRLVEGLRPPALDELGLAGALTQVTERLSAGVPLALELEIAELPRLPAAVEVAAFRIMSEAVSNAVRHAGASRCSVAVDAAGPRLRIVIADDGHGIDAAKPSTSTGGHG